MILQVKSRSISSCKLVCAQPVKFYDGFMKSSNRIKSIFGRNVKKDRELAGLSQNEFAEKLACNGKYISEIETGKSFASSELMEDMVAVLGVPVSFLFATPEDKVEGSKLIDDAIDTETAKLAVTLKEIVRRG